MSAQPQPAPLPDPEQTLRAFLRGELERSKPSDPLALVDPVMPQLSDDDYDVAARYGINRMLSEEARHLRKRTMRRPDEYDSAGAPKSPKWRKAGDVAQARPDVFSAHWVVVGVDEHGKDTSKLLGDCEKLQLFEAADLLRERADARHAAEHARADCYITLARMLPDGAVVRSLPRETVESVLDQ